MAAAKLNELTAWAKLGKVSQEMAARFQDAHYDRDSEEKDIYYRNDAELKLGLAITDVFVHSPIDFGRVRVVRFDPVKGDYLLSLRRRDARTDRYQVDPADRFVRQFTDQGVYTKHFLYRRDYVEINEEIRQAGNVHSGFMRMILHSSTRTTRHATGLKRAHDISGSFPPPL